MPLIDAKPKFNEFGFPFRPSIVMTVKSKTKSKYQPHIGKKESRKFVARIKGQSK